MKRRGISLITLVITIIVTVILASVVVLSIVNNNKIEKARISKYAEMYNGYKDQIYTSGSAVPLLKPDLSESNVVGNSLKSYIPQMSDDETNNWVIIGGELIRREETGLTLEEKEALEKCNIRILNYSQIEYEAVLNISRTQELGIPLNEEVFVSEIKDGVENKKYTVGYNYLKSGEYLENFGYLKYNYLISIDDSDKCNVIACDNSDEYTYQYNG